MKKLLLTLSIVLVFTSFSIAQDVEVPQIQSPVIVKIAASWCPPCGGWGWTFFDDIYEDNEGDAIFLSVHHSGDHTNPTSQALTTNFSVFSQPRFIFDGTDQNVSSSNASSKRTDFQNMVIQQNELMPSIQSGIDASFYEDTIHVDYSVELFDNLNGDYFLGLYLVEKVHIGNQAGVGPNAEHKELLRDEIHGNSFGVQLFSGASQEGSIFNGNVDYPLEDYDPTNLSIVSVIWEKVGNSYQVVNSNKDEEVEEQIVNSTENSSIAEVEFFVYPTNVYDKFNLKIHSDEDLGHSIVSISDLLGRKVEKLYDGPWLKEGINLQSNRPEGFKKGIYFVSMVSPKRKITKKIFFE